MGKKKNLSDHHDNLVKKLKKLAKKLQDVPQCNVKKIPYDNCCNGCCLDPCNTECLVVSNDPPKSSCSFKYYGKCGPYPPSCTTILPTRRCTKWPCCCNSYNSCEYPKNQMCYCCNCCKNPNCCCSYVPPTMCCCKKKTYCRPQTGNIYLGCNSLCIPASQNCIPLTCKKSIEIRGGTLYRCDCERKNGLQDSCLRYCCLNNPNCRTMPPTCHCCRFSLGKHLAQRYGRKPRKCFTCYVCEPPPCPPPMCSMNPMMLPCCYYMPCCCGKKCRCMKKCNCCRCRKEKPKPKPKPKPPPREPSPPPSPEPTPPPSPEPTPPITPPPEPTPEPTPTPTPEPTPTPTPSESSTPTLELICECESSSSSSTPCIPCLPPCDPCPPPCEPCLPCPPPCEPCLPCPPPCNPCLPYPPPCEPCLPCPPPCEPCLPCPPSCEPLCSCDQTSSSSFYPDDEVCSCDSSTSTSSKHYKCLGECSKSTVKPPSYYYEAEICCCNKFTQCCPEIIEREMNYRY